MSPREIAGRVHDNWVIWSWRRERLWLSPDAAVPATLPDPPVAPVALLSGPDLELLRAEAEELCHGRMRLLSLAYREQPVDWHRDPASGRTAPRAFAFDIPYHSPAVVGNIKNVWEKSRHHHLTVLALAFAKDRNDRFANEVESQLRNWLDANPISRGVNWASALELGVRLIAWVWIERLLRGSPAHERLFGTGGAMWPSIYWHQRMIQQRRSHGSSANNHLIGEMAGLYIAASAWPVFPESAAWRDDAAGSLARCLVEQTFPSGLNREQAFGYHLFVLEFVLLCLAESREQDSQRSVLDSVATRMLKAMRAISDLRGNLPRYGDGDEGVAVQLRPTNSARVRWIEQLASTLGVRNHDGPATASRVFADAGIFALASTTDDKREIFCLFDAGQHGFLSIAAHGHADALAFALNIDGTPVIVDTGTFAYHTDPARRRYFRGTSAHNTVIVDDEDQSVQAGPFLWSSVAQCSVLQWQPKEDGGIVVAEHDGYARLPGRPSHRRSLTLAGNHLDIVDDVSGSGSHVLEWRLHFSPICSVVIEDRACRVEWRTAGRPSASTLLIELDPQLAWNVEHGTDRGGWYSPAFNLVEPTHMLVGRMSTTLPARLNHHLRIK
jgi:hypothetical protein